MNKSMLPIHDPCHQDWSSMDGPAQKRFCGQCSKHVHDLSSMTEPEARRVLHTVDEPCVRYTCAPDGAIRFKPPRPVTLARAGMIAGCLMIGGMPAAASVSPQEGAIVAEEQTLMERIAETFWSLFAEPPAPSLPEGVEVDTPEEPLEPLEPEMGVVVVSRMGKPVYIERDNLEQPEE